MPLARDRGQSATPSLVFRTGGGICVSMKGPALGQLRFRGVLCAC